MDLVIYDNLYTIMIDIFGGANNPILETTCQVVATLGTLFLVALPFLVVWKVIKIIVG